MSSKETSPKQFFVKHKMLLHLKFFRKFLTKYDLYFPLAKYHVVNKMLIELDRFEQELKPIHYSKFFDRSK
jgi:hypothetical protein